MTGRLALLLTLGLTAIGCGSGLDSTYGVVGKPSLNGTSALAELFRKRGDEVRVVWRLDEDLSDWADTIVRFCPYPGPPDGREGDWYLDWLDISPRHRLICVLRGYQADVEYWNAVLKGLPKDATERRAQVERVWREARDEERTRARWPWVSDSWDSEGWFRLEPVASTPRIVERLDGPWASGIDARRAAIVAADRLLPDDPDLSRTLLAGPDSAQVLESVGFQGRGLIVANGSFLLNGALLNSERRPLASRLVAWPGERPRHVAFVEGWAPWDPPPDDAAVDSPSGLSLLWRWPELRWAVGHLLALGLLAALAASVRLGRPLAASRGGEDRPSAHAEALGDLLARTDDRRRASEILESYRKWRGLG